MAKFTAVYEENEEGLYELLLIVTQTFLTQQDRELWLVELAQELAKGDLWAIQLIEGEDLEEFVLVLE